MDNIPHVRLKLPDRSYTNYIKKEIRKLAEKVGFSSHRLAEIDIIASELLSNLHKHSKEGEILIKSIESEEERGLELISVDRGPGMANVDDMMTDGRSTTSTLGQGLGAIKRLSDEFDVYSLPSWGTILLSRNYSKKPVADKKTDLLSVHAVMLAKPGEHECGDGWTLLKRKHHYKLLALDGLGHGVHAANATKLAIKEFAEQDNISPAETIQDLHSKIKGTRGAVGMVFHIDKIGNSISFTGLGNISARLSGAGKSKNCISYNGIIGFSIPSRNSLKSNVIPWQQDEIMIIHSDGLKTRWELTHLPKIHDRDGSIIAAAIYKDFTRDNDDLLVIVLKKRK
jgi:anti-sigma regulatory factor (Ser/Thr protein kinase)